MVNAVEKDMRAKQTAVLEQRASLVMIIILNVLQDQLHRHRQQTSLMMIDLTVSRLVIGIVVKQVVRGMVRQLFQIQLQHVKKMV